MRHFSSDIFEEEEVTRSNVQVVSPMQQPFGLGRPNTPLRELPTVKTCVLHADHPFFHRLAAAPERNILIKPERQLKVRESQGMSNMKWMQSRESGEFEGRGRWKTVEEVQSECPNQLFQSLRMKLTRVTCVSSDLVFAGSVVISTIWQQ
jgi:hypothetical protein